MNYPSLLRLHLTIALCGALWMGQAMGQHDMQVVELHIAELQMEVGSASTDEERLEASNRLKEALIEAFGHEETFTHPFPSWTKMGAMRSPDDAFRMFNWNVALLDGTFRYQMLLLLPDKSHHALDGNGDLSHDTEYKVLSATQWYGALYYHIEVVRHKGDTWYTILGWDGHNTLSNKKVIDVLWFDKKGDIHFGKPVFEHPSEKKKRTRRVFEYAKSSQMTLAYLPQKQMLVYDLLVPKPGAKEGNYAFYTSSTSYDGYRLKAGEWLWEENVDMTRPKSEEGKSQFNFPARPDLNRARGTNNPLTGE